MVVKNIKFCYMDKQKWSVHTLLQSKLAMQ